MTYPFVETALCGFFIGLLTALCGLLYAAKGHTAQIFGRSIHRGSGQRRSVALTFDDGPSPGSLELSRYLAEQHIPATFFFCGSNVLRHPDIARDLSLAGHEVGNHSFSHRRLCPRFGKRWNLLSARIIFREFAETQAAIIACTGTAPRLLRAPYGLRWLGLGAAQRKLGLLGVTWSIIGHDWEWSGERVAQHVLANVFPGSIICLHDGRDSRENPDISATLAAVRAIVPRLREMGYEFETVSSMLASQPLRRSSLEVKRDKAIR